MGRSVFLVLGIFILISKIAQSSLLLFELQAICKISISTLVLTKNHWLCLWVVKAPLSLLHKFTCIAVPFRVLIASSTTFLDNTKCESLLTLVTFEGWNDWFHFFMNELFTMNWSWVQCQWHKHLSTWDWIFLINTRIWSNHLARNFSQLFHRLIFVKLLCEEDSDHPWSDNRSINHDYAGRLAAVDVNDKMLPIPFLLSFFYWRNHQ